MTRNVVVARPVDGATLAGATWPRAPRSASERELERLIERRVRVLTVIAERFAELVDPLGGPSGVRGDGDAVGLMPRTYTPSVREFERLAVRLRLEERSLWWHLDGWWLSAQTRTVWLCPRCGVCHQSQHRHPSRRSSGKLVTVHCKRVLVWSRRAGARESLALEAVGVMAGWWGLGSEPMLPDELRVAA